MKSISSATLWIIIFLVVILLFMSYTNHDQPDKLDLIAWKAKADSGELFSATDTGGKIEGEYWVDKAANKKSAYVTEYLDGQQEKILDIVLQSQESENPIPYSAKPKNLMFQTLFFSVLPIFILVILFLFFMRQIQSSGNKAISFGKSKAKLVQEGQIKITFKDVAGVEEACEELKEIVEYLKDPKKFSRLGGKIPKGVLLVGPPGTGKTLLAKAIAGEANVPFFSISGSDFVEMFVGVGASRVRDLFDNAKKSRPCIIFIDEIDAVGRSRFAGIGGSHDEREQTLNQLLVEMDGFQDNEGVILIAATNRPDVLDPALLRPGRFDRQVMVGLPDLRGREQILNVHSKKVKLDPTANLAKIAKVTPGFSGADLANLINEAALLAARAGDDQVRMEKLEEAKDRVMMGPERRSMVINEKEKLVIAYHEAGHAVVSRFTKGGGEEVHKVTIIPRGPALGVTWILPSEEKHNHSRQQIINQLYYLMGGRAAEEIKFGEFTTGAANDLERVTNLAHKMVCVFGMSERLGPRTFGEPSGHVFLGKEMTRERNYSEETATIIDEEIKRYIEDAYAKTMETLKEHRDVLDRVAEALVERETIDGEEFEMLVQGQPLPPPKPPTPSPQAKQEETAQRSAPKPKIDPMGNPRIQPSA